MKDAINFSKMNFFDSGQITSNAGDLTFQNTNDCKSKSFSK